MTFSVAMKRATELAQANAWQLAAIAHHLARVPGDIAECGAWRGGTTIALASASPHKRVFAFDTFSGMPSPSEFDLHKRGDFPTTFDEASENTRDFPNIVLVEGEFRTTIPAFAPRPLSLLVLDCDLYDSYYTCLLHLWPLVSPGGWVVLEDYAVADCPGARRACDEFFGPERIERRFGQPVVIK